MKKKILVVSLSAFLASCGGGSDSSTAASVQADGGAVSAASSGASNSSSGVESSTFLANAYQDNALELALSELAVQKASDSDVRAFAQRMIDDHTQAINEIRQLAQEKNITLQTELTTERAAVLKRLSNLNGTEFDKVYMNSNVQIHEQSVSLFATQANSGTDANVKTFSANTLPLLQVHLLAAKSIDGKINPAAFLVNAYIDGKAEILLSTLALQKATDADVKQFAQRLIDDHTRANNEIIQLAQAEGIDLPEDITAEHQIVNENISRISGADFDKAYMNHNVVVHIVDVLQASWQSSRGTEVDIKEFATTMLPILVGHLQTANEIYERLPASLPFSAFKNSVSEILIAKLALQKSTNTEVREFAQRIINDHTSLNNQIIQLAQENNLVLPNEVSPAQLRAYLNLFRLSGADFDTAYVEHSINVHTKEVERFQQNATNGANAALNAFINASLPVLSAHLDLAKQISIQLNPAVQ